MNNDYVLAVFQNKIETLDVSKYPATQVAEPINVFLQSPFHVLSSEGLIVEMRYNMLVRVHQLDVTTNQWNIKHAFIVDGDEAFSDDRKYTLKGFGIYYYLFASCIASYLLVGSLSEGLIHIWNINSGTKMKKVVSPLKDCSIEEIIKTGSDTNFIIVAHEGGSDSSGSTFLAYDNKFHVLTIKQKSTRSLYPLCFWTMRFNLC